MTSIRPAFLAAVAAFTMGCTTPVVPTGGANMPAGARQWLERGRASYRSGDVDDARDAAKNALAAAPEQPEVRIFAARVHLARLEYAEAIRLLTGLETPEARALRGRAHWYAGELEAAADDLEAVLQDPASKDEWAKAISALARRGIGRKPFTVTGGLLVPLPMPRIRGTHLIVPVEVDGEQGLAEIATGKGEVILDQTTRKEPSWVSLRFGERIEVRDVPALVEDLSGISKDVGAPIKALLGVNLLRRLDVTFDFGGEQFVVRTRDPGPPPNATRVPIAYAQGGAMMTRVILKTGAPEVPVMVNTLLPVPIAMDDRAFKTAGVDLGSLQTTPIPNMKAGRLASLRLGAFEIPDVPAFYGPSFAEVAAATGVDVEGAIGSGMLAAFRCTMTDGGRTLWLEDLPPMVMQMLQQQQSAPPDGAPPQGAPPQGPPPQGPQLTPPPSRFQFPNGTPDANAPPR